MAKTNNIAVTTPTGKVGSKVVQRLQDDGRTELILLVRDPQKVQHFVDKGATAFKVDLKDADAVKKATEGVDTLFWVNPPDYQTEDIVAYYSMLAENAADAVKSNGIQRVVFLSSIGAHLGEGVGPVNGFKNAEAILKKACKNLVVLRPTLFMENYMMSVESIQNDGKVYLPVDGKTAVPMIATDDVADAAARALTESFDGFSVRPLHGPRDYTFIEVADAIGQAIGKPVSHEQVTQEQTRKALLTMGLNQTVADAFVEMYHAIDTGYMKGEKPRSQESTTPTTVDQFAQNVLKPIVVNRSKG